MIIKGVNPLPAYGWVGQGQRLLAAHFVKRNTKFGGGGKRGRAKIPSPQPPSFLPARAFSLARGACRQFHSKKVRIWSNKRTSEAILLFLFLVIK